MLIVLIFVSVACICEKYSPLEREDQLQYLLFFYVIVISEVHAATTILCYLLGDPDFFLLLSAMC
jgi:hypothetical protein